MSADARLREAAEYIVKAAEGQGWHTSGIPRLNMAVTKARAALGVAGVLDRTTDPALDADLLARALWAWGYDALGPVMRDDVKEPTDAQRRMAHKLAAEYDRLAAHYARLSATPDTETGE